VELPFLSHFRARRRKAKLQQVLRLATPSTALALQEVRGSVPELEAILRPLAGKRAIFASLVPGSAAGGVVTILPACPSTCGSLRAVPVVPGRVLRTTWTDGPKQWIHWNVHNYDLSDPDLRRVESLFRRDTLAAAAAPALVSLVAAGDRNFPHDGASRTRLSDSDDHDAQRLRHHAPPRLHRLLAPLTFLQGPEYTHFAAAPASLANLDRIYVSYPRWQLLQLQVSDLSSASPVAYHLSDHIPVAIGLASRAPLPGASRPIPRWVAASPRLPPPP